MNARDMAVRISDGGVVKKAGAGWMVCCPAHADTSPSLSVAPGEKQDVVLHCHAGCSPNDVLAAANVTWDEVSTTDSRSKEEIVYDYTTTDGTLVYQVVRKPGKKFLQRRPDANGGWVWNLKGVTRFLYRMPAVMAAVDSGQMIWIAEGEKDAEAICDAGVCGTTMPGGAGKWQDTYSMMLEGADVTVWADKDKPGLEHAHQVRDSLTLYGAASVRIVQSAHGKDAADHLGSGLTLDDVQVIDGGVETPIMFLRADEFVNQEREVKPWAIPTLMRRGGERLILTGYEGYGKSALLKQIAVCTAVGLHPFTLLPNGEKKRVVFIDCENPKEDLIEDFDRLRNAATREGAWDNPDLFIECHPPMNLGGVPDAVWLSEQARAHKPDLLIIGPLYNLMSEDSAKEVEVNKMLRALSKVQVEVDCALIMEHHVPHPAPGEKRPIRPIGSTVLQRWASFGYGLLPTNVDDPAQPFEFKPWRGSRRRGRSWPTAIRQVGTGGKGWYWVQTELVD